MGSKFQQKHLQTYTMCIIGLMTALTCVLGPWSIPLPFTGVPISFTNLALFLSIIILGWKHAFISTILYLLLGTVGLPVFSGFTGGFSKLAGPTGGYLIGFLFLVVISGLLIHKNTEKKWLIFIALVIGNCADYFFGTIWLAKQMGTGFTAALSTGVLPFIAGDIIKIIFALMIGTTIRRQLEKCNLL